jgi:hypothetical protein
MDDQLWWAGSGPLEVVVLSAFEHNRGYSWNRANVLKMNIAKAVSNFAFRCTGLSEV